MAKQEIIKTTVPVGSKWRTDDLEAKAEKHGMNKSEFMIMAIDTFMGFDDDFIKTMQKYADGLHTEMFIVIQNMIIRQLARNEARKNVVGKAGEILDQFLTIDRGDGPYMMTGNELMDHLVKKYTFEEQRKKDEFDAKLKR